MNIRPTLPLALLLSCSLAPTLARADFAGDWAKMKAIPPQEYLCFRTATPPTIDGRLDDAVWQQAAWTADFADIEGAAKPKPRFRTRAKMLWDDNYFYIAAELEEPHVWATLTQHDAVIFNDPDFEVFIDPDGDCHDYYEFEMNALNTGWDLLLKKPYKDGGPALNSWEIRGLKTAVHIKGTLNQPADQDEGWSVEIAFPWKALAPLAQRPAPPGEGDQWRVGFSRVEWLIEIINGHYQKVKGHREDNWVWSPQGIVDMHRPEKWGYVQFTQQPPGTARFVPDPSAPARDLLQGFYYAQKDFHQKNKRWAKTLEELDPTTRWQENPFQPHLHGSADGWEASAIVLDAPTKRRTWRIRQDARVWHD